MVVDFEKAWLALKAHIVAKNSHGQRELLTRMVEIEVDCALPEGERDFDPTPSRKQSAIDAPVGA